LISEKKNALSTNENERKTKTMHFYLTIRVGRGNQQADNLIVSGRRGESSTLRRKVAFIGRKKNKEETPLSTTPAQKN
jgi:hypothetical protein